MLNKIKSNYKHTYYPKLIVSFEPSCYTEPLNPKEIGLCLGKAVVAVSESQFTFKGV